MEAVFVFWEGVLAFVSPCILPMLPVYIVYLAGRQEDGGRKRLIVNTLGFILGFTIIFVSLGATASAIGNLLNDHRLLIQRISGVVIILFGLHYMGVFKIGFLSGEKRFAAKTKDLTFLTSVLFGMAFSFGWTPCIGIFLGSALMLASNQETVLRGVLLLFVFSLGLGVPFFVSALILNKLKAAFTWIKSHYRIITAVSGVLLILCGLALLFDVFGYWAALFNF